MTDDPNPFAPPVTVSDIDRTRVLGNIDPATLKKVKAVVKDANQFWLAILLCVLCGGGMGMLIIGPWYLVRLIQWGSLAQQQPMLMDRDVPRGSLAQRFQSAKIRLIIGLGFGALMLASQFALVVFVAVS